MDLFDLSGRVALVTGGNGGIGFAFAKAMARAGADVMVAGRNTEKNATAVAALAEYGGRASSTTVDVTDAKSVEAMIATTKDAFGRLDILVNNAGTNIRKSPELYTLDEWHTVIETNLTSAFICCHAAYPIMKAGGRGKIVNIGSMLSIFGTEFAAAYAASKGGIVQFTKALATSWAKDNIQVNAVLPGWIDTDLTRKARQDVPTLNDRVLARTPTGRWGVPDDHAGVAVFLAGSGSDFVTGTAIPVDGGFSVQG